MKVYILIFLGLINVCSMLGVKLPSLFSNHMVLQQLTSVPMWGTSRPNQEIKISPSWTNKCYTVIADSKGNWRSSIPTPSAGGPYEINFSDGESYTLSDVLIGEVWLCSGQSNMSQPMKGYPGQPIERAGKYINEANPARPIRVGHVDYKYSRIPQEECPVVWQQTTPETVSNTSAVAFYFADYLQKMLDVPVGIIISAWGGADIRSFMDYETLKANYPGIDFSILQGTEEVKNPQHKPTLLYNNMIYPLKDFALKGVIWYQGETNRSKAHIYENLQKLMMNSWRRQFNNPEMPFYYVQIAPYVYNKENPFMSGFFYEAQQNIMKNNPNCGMVSTIDLGQSYCIHAPYKQPVGERLALWALANDYGKDVHYTNPSYGNMEIKDSKITISIDNADMGLNAPDPENLTGFEIATDNETFVPAKAKLVNGGKEIIIWNDSISQPVAVRYCFRDYQPGTVFDNFGMPLLPFRTDKWENKYLILDLNIL